MLLGISLQGFGLVSQNELSIGDQSAFSLELLDDILNIYSKSLRYFQDQDDGQVPEAFLLTFDKFHRMRRAAHALHRQRPASLKRVTFNESKTKVFFIDDVEFTEISFAMPNEQGSAKPKQKRRIPRLTDAAKRLLFGSDQSRKVSPSQAALDERALHESRFRSSRLASIVPV
eukprot:TRINITY_DN14354_c1_g1_i1.p1 TRINITY_DN14354_c1_g1~~TRINITY_DN14354_c1_g1_i1.p1  ORF type:complete len:173 (-),score=18.69 TRINITY_DN14354_c1_g1_i1:315-833(-)